MRVNISMKRKVVFYKTNYICPIQNFLDSLPGKAAQKIVWVLKLFEDLEIVPGEYIRKITGTKYLWECRIKFGSISYRVLYFFTDIGEIVLTNGFIKKTRKTPRHEIEKAESYRKEYFRRVKV